MEFNVFESIKIGLASPDKIREWSHGEVKKPETINYRTLKPERDGPVLRAHFSGLRRTGSAIAANTSASATRARICDRCGVEVTRAKVRQ